MKTSRINQTFPASRHALARGIAIACALFCTTAIAQQPPRAARACPLGYIGSYPHCTLPVAKTVVPSSAGVTPTTKPRPRPIEEKILDPHKLPPRVGPGPIEHSGDATSKHGIIFVGGHSQKGIDQSKAALNPQPIPPGHLRHLRHTVPQAGAPIDSDGH